MNLKNLTNEEFCDVVRKIEKIYNRRIPRNVKAALFIHDIRDPQRNAINIERRIVRGRESLKRKLASTDRVLLNKLFYDKLCMTERDLQEMISHESNEVSMSAHICRERLSVSKEIPLNHFAHENLVNLREVIDQLICNCE